MTAGRRTSPVPQLYCIGGSAQGRFEPETVLCKNVGFDGHDVQWQCEAEMPEDVSFAPHSIFSPFSSIVLGLLPSSAKATATQMIHISSKDPVASNTNSNSPTWAVQTAKTLDTPAKTQKTPADILAQAHSSTKNFIHIINEILAGEEHPG
jgi:hypothetical protein